MTTQSFSKKYLLENYPEIFEQFEKSVCLTYNYTMSCDYYEAKKIFKHKHGRLVSSVAKFSLSSESDFAFFSDGTLYVDAMANPRRAENFKQWLTNQGYTVNVKKLPKSFLAYDINRYACEITQDKIIFEPLEDKETFIKKIFKNNICLSGVLPKLKSDILAFFADGRLIVSEKYKKSTYGIYDTRKISDFQMKNNEYFYFQAEYVPQEYIDAIYAKAAELNPQHQNFEKENQTQLSLKQKEEIDKLIQEIYQNDNHCVSVIYPFRMPNFTPDRENFILFANGELIIDEKQGAFFDPIEAEAQKKCPSKKIRMIKVPASYVEEIYKFVITKQKSAKEIYLEMLKQKAKKLGKKLSLPHYESLELAAHMSGWNNWKEVTMIDENRARFTASIEKKKKDDWSFLGEDNALDLEYKEYLENK